MKPRWIAIMSLPLWLACSSDPTAPSGGADTSLDSAGLDASADAGDTRVPEVSDEPNDGRCSPGTAVCSSARTYLLCGDDGLTRTQVQCDPGLGCLSGECTPTICDPFEIDGCLGEHTLNACNFSGTAWIAEECPEFWTCQAGACIAPPCLPGSFQCDGLDRILTCDPETGEYVEQEQCEQGTACYEDECQPLCEISRKLRSYVGCEYWSVDLDNLADAETIEHTVVLANPSTDVAAEVEVVNPDGEPLQLEDTTVPPDGQLVIRFPIDGGLIRPGVTDFSWRITSTVPVTAHQFNPLDNFTDPFSNDGTLLLPTHALGSRYYVASWVHREHPTSPLNGFVSLVAVDAGPTDVQITTSSNALVGDGASPMVPGEQRAWTLERGQTLTLQTAGAGDDLTGSLVEAEGGRIAVFGGHECANVVLGVDRCDHIETQLLPTALLRNQYVATKYAPRVDDGVRSEPDVWRVLAIEGATVIRTEPEIPDVHGTIIASGEWVEIIYRDDFILTADRPVLVAHYMVGANWTGIPRECFDSTGPPTGIGDPAMTQLVPVEQYRDNYIVLSPFAYLEDYINIAVPAGAEGSVRVDGTAVSEASFVPIGSSDWLAVRIAVEDGPHRVTAGVPVGLDVYGYSCHVSYAYPGGMNLEGIEIDEEDRPQ